MLLRYTGEKMMTNQIKIFLKNKKRIKKKSVLKADQNVQEKHKLPSDREREDFTKRNLPPGDLLNDPIINLDLKEKVSKK